MPQPIQLRRTRGWRLPPGAMSVARPTRHGNPFRVGATAYLELGRRPGGELIIPGYGNYWTDDLPVAGFNEPLPITITADLAVALFELEWSIRLDLIAADPDLGADWQADLDALRGHDLACWCPLGAPCHRNVLLRIANQPRT